MFKKATAIDLKIYGPDHPDMARDHNNLANVYRTQVLRQSSIIPGVLEMLPRCTGAFPGVLELLTAYWSLTAHLCLWSPVQGKFDEAIELYLKALAIFEKVKGESSTEVATLSNNIAGLYKRQVL